MYSGKEPLGQLLLDVLYCTAVFTRRGHCCRGCLQIYHASLHSQHSTFLGLRHKWWLNSGSWLIACILTLDLEVNFKIIYPSNSRPAFMYISLFVVFWKCETTKVAAIYSHHMLPFFADRHSCPLPPATKRVLIILEPAAALLLYSGMF